MADTIAMLPLAMSILLFIFVSLVSTTDAHITMESPADSVKSKFCHQLFSRYVKCTDKSVLLKFGNCATETKGDIYIAKCHYFQLERHNVLEPGYIRLPDNISELNDYMCGPMNRKGLLCKDCIDGFGPSVTSLGYKCSNCTDAWYGIPLYLAVELIPITLFYLVILIFKVHLTSAPMVLFILYHQLIMYALIFQRTVRLRILFSQGNGPLLKSLFFLYGIWSLNSVHLIVPPFCVSSKLQLMYVVFFGCIPVIYLLFLIFLTWVCIELHGRNFKLLLVLWRPFHRCFVKLQRGWDKTSSMVDVFATFFLLSHGRLVYQVVIFLQCQNLYFTKDGSPDGIHVLMFMPYVDCKHRSYPVWAFSVLVLLAFNIIPLLLLVCYPFKLFRVCLSNVKLERLFISIFVEKFHGCYRDGLDGGRDMRSFSGLYYVMIIFLSQYTNLQIWRLSISCWLYYAFIFLSFTLLIIIVRPYKQKYVNILDTLLLVYAAVFFILLSRDPFAGEDTQIFIFLLIPSIVFGLLVVFKALMKIKNCLIKECKNLYGQYCIKHNTDSKENSNKTQTLIDPTSSHITYGK